MSRRLRRARQHVGWPGTHRLLWALGGGATAGAGAAIALAFHVDHPGQVLIASVVVATALNTNAGLAATAAGAWLFPFADHTADSWDVLLFFAVASAVLALASRMRREQARLGLSDHRYRTLVEELPVGLYLDLPDATATNVYSNPELVRMLGYPAEAWTGDPDFFPSLLHPDDRERVLDSLAAAVKDGGRFDELYRLRAASGDYRWIADRGALVKDEAGQPLYVQGVLLDVTAERDAEMRAAAAQRRYETLIHELPLVTYIEDAHELGHTLYISPQVEGFLGYPVERWLEDKDFFFTVLDPAFHGDVRGARSDGETDTAREYRLLAADGSHRWIDSRRALVRDSAGEPLYVQGLWLDVTERRDLEDQLRRQERLDTIGQLTAGVAHNFNNMLMAMRGHAELAQRRDRIEAARADLGVILDTADRSSRLVQQLLAFSCRQQMLPRPTDLRELVAELLDLLRPLLGEDVALRYTAPPAPMVAAVDRAQFEQVLVNLAVNARDAMPAGGTFTIELATAADGGIVVNVRDTGGGIPAPIAGRVFDPFFTTKETGTGLGLASVHGMVRQIGGTICIRETGPAGTTFEIRLPAVEQADIDVAA